MAHHGITWVNWIQRKIQYLSGWIPTLILRKSMECSISNSLRVRKTAMFTAPKQIHTFIQQLWTFTQNLRYLFILFNRLLELYNTQRVRKFKKVQAKKLVKSNKSRFSSSWNCIFWQFSQFIFEIAKNGIWLKKLFVKLIYLISRIFWPGLF